MNYQQSAVPAYSAQPARMPDMQNKKPRLKVIEGTKENKQANTVHLQQLLTMPVLLAMFALVACFAIGRIALTVSAAQTGLANQKMQAEISEIDQINDELEIENTALRDDTRIIPIATQNYGMVQASTVPTIDARNPQSFAHQDQSSQSIQSQAKLKKQLEESKDLVRAACDSHAIAHALASAMQ